MSNRVTDICLQKIRKIVLPEHFSPSHCVHISVHLTEGINTSFVLGKQFILLVMGLGIEFLNPAVN